jgi:formate dehydrogenase subunit gamma
MRDRNTGFGALIGLLVVLVIAAIFFFPDTDTDAPDENASVVAAREATGGAQTREDIMARQRGEAVDYEFRRSATGDAAAAADPTGQLGTLGGTSDAEVFRALRYNSANVTTSSHGPASDVLIQDGGMNWLMLRDTRMAPIGGALLLGMTGLIAVFYLLRGRVPIAGGRAGRTIERFGGFDRFIHWMTAGSFILLAVTGLISMYGRTLLIPLMGHEAHAVLAHWSKLIHNNASFAFALGVILIIVKWVPYNIPNRNDLKWIWVMGGLFDDSIHPPAGKFNAGQKIIFWSVVGLSFVVVATGISLLVPFQAPSFGGLFGAINNLGVLGWFGMADLPTQLSPQQEMQYTQVIHAVFAFLFMAMIIGHIYIGTLGMEGAFDAMGSGHVDEQWAKEHHSLWYDEVKAKEAASQAKASPAE